MYLLKLTLEAFDKIKLPFFVQILELEGLALNGLTWFMLKILIIYFHTKTILVHVDNINNIFPRPIECV